jgi:Cdc6-like AAA superfamily ATPase
MKDTIFAVRGKANIGKTSTIKYICEFLKEKYPNAVINEIILLPDIKIIITIEDILIGIESEGDPNGRLEESLDDFVKNNCNIIICGARTRGMTNDWIKKYSNKFEIKWITKVISKNKTNEDKDNRNQAIEIVKKIELLLKGV